jgi:hypothetical protein
VTLIPESPRTTPALRGRDIVLILILVLAAVVLFARFVGPLVELSATGRGAAVLVGIQLLLLTMQSIVLIGAVYLVAVRRRAGTAARS